MIDCYTFVLGRRPLRKVAGADLNLMDPSSSEDRNALLPLRSTAEAEVNGYESEHATTATTLARLAAGRRLVEPAEHNRFLLHLFSQVEHLFLVGLVELHAVLQVLLTEPDERFMSHAQRLGLRF